MTWAPSDRMAKDSVSGKGDGSKGLQEVGAARRMPAWRVFHAHSPDITPCPLLVTLCAPEHKPDGHLL